MGKINVDGTEIQILHIEEDDYISLTDMVVHTHTRILHLNLQAGYLLNSNYILLRNLRG